MKIKTYRPIWAEINLKNLDYNYRLTKKIVGHRVKILVPVKAHGYGHGIIPVSRRLQSLGVDYLGVAGIDEGIVLRKSGIKKPILILGSILPEDVVPVIENRLTQTVCTLEVALRLNQEAKRRKTKALVHVKIDTGMHRIGVSHWEARGFIKDLSSLSSIKIEGVFTHFPCADNDPDFTRKQIQIFNSIVRQLEKDGIFIPLRHASNSMGIIDFPCANFNLVRPGLIVYGLYPRNDISSFLFKLKPLLSLKTKIIHISTVAKGKGISYGHSYITSRNSRIATISVGYGDGYLRCLSGKAYCLVSGKRARIVGRICMDQAMVDVTGINKVSIGDEVVLIGSQGRESITVEELTSLADTIPYEIVCSLGTRVNWRYKS